MSNSLLDDYERQRKSIVTLQAEVDKLKEENARMAALLEITLNAGVEPSRLDLVLTQEENTKLRAALNENVQSSCKCHFCQSARQVLESNDEQLKP